ncbi:hypothetical protein OUZ56_010624 [Daphnia magna]|uniref:Uncharacterized protein n=1 Tax=Daphnia magna TaxID=35525 RepID=A0ABR0AJ29_9CRUS|nr:hypothetical protein OUZ56_010624 [Daphnia magna]
MCCSPSPPRALPCLRSSGRTLPLSIVPREAGRVRPDDRDQVADFRIDLKYSAEAAPTCGIDEHDLWEGIGTDNEVKDCDQPHKTERMLLGDARNCHQARVVTN